MDRRDRHSGAGPLATPASRHRLHLQVREARVREAARIKARHMVAFQVATAIAHRASLLASLPRSSLAIPSGPQPTFVPEPG